MRVLAWLVDLAAPFILAVELFFGSTVVITVAITPMVIIVAILAAWLAVVFATQEEINPIVSIILMLRFPSGTMLAVATAAIGCTVSVRLVFPSTVMASIMVGIAASLVVSVVIAAIVFPVFVITTLVLIRRQAVKHAVFNILLLAEEHGLANFLHQGSFKLVPSHQERIKMQTAKRTMESFLGFFNRLIGLHSDGQPLCALEALFSTTVVVKARCHCLFGYSSFHGTEHDIKTWCI